MSSMKSAIAILANEPKNTSAAVQTVDATAKPFLVTNSAERSDDPVTRRVQAALDLALASGSMPA